MPKKKFFFCWILVFIIFFKFSFLASYNQVFSNEGLEEDLSNWEFTSDDWTIKDFDGKKKLGIKVTGNYHVEEAILKHLSQNNYTLELDMYALEGVDKNLLFRVKDSLNRHGIHINSNINHICFERWIDGEGWDECKSLNFSNDKTYKLKLKAHGKNFKFYVDDQLIFNRSEEIHVREGTIGLKVSTGASSPSEVYFDNIQITPILTPIVILPGHTGSINYSEMFLEIDNPDGWRMVPGVHVYDNLIASLEEAGYEKGKNLFVYNYNWLQSIEETADELHDFVVGVTEDHISDEVQMIGHSMGGLLARTCAQQFSDNCLADEIVTVGSPHRGSLTAYGAWEAGQIWREPAQRLLLSLFLKTKARLGETQRQTIQRIAPSTQDMLPDFPYLKDAQGQILSYGETNYPQSGLYREINNPIQLDAINFVYGQGVDTLASLKVDKNLPWWEKALGNWPHGKVVEKEYSQAGDCAILTKSSAPSEVIDFREFNFDHTGLVKEKESIAGIFELLDITGEPVITDNTSISDEYLAFYLQSPAYLTTEDIGGQIFTAPQDGEAGLVIIADPELNPDSRVKVTGASSGQYTLWAGKVNSDETVWRKTIGQTEAGQVDTYKVQPDSFTSLVQSTADNGGLPHLLDRLTQLFTPYPELREKQAILSGLIDNNLPKAIEYAHQLRNYTSLLYSQQDGLPIEDIIRTLDDIIALLQSRQLPDAEPAQAQASLTDTQQILENLKSFTWEDISLRQNKTLSARLFKRADFSRQRGQGLLNSNHNTPAYYNLENSYYWGKNSLIFLE